MYLALNGIEVPVVEAELSAVPIGADWRAPATGRLRRGVQRHLREWKFRTVPLPLSESYAYAMLIDGAGESWRLDSDSGAYSDGGVAASMPEVVDAPLFPKYGDAYLAIVGSEQANFALPGSDWTFSVWIDNAGTWELYVVRSRGGDYTHAVNAGPETEGLPDGFSIVGGLLRLTDLACDNAVLTPYVWPAGWDAQVYASFQPFTLPRLTATGDFDPDTPLWVESRIEGVEQEQLADGMYERVTFSLREVG